MYLVTHFLTAPQQTVIFEFLNHVILATSPGSSTGETLGGFCADTLSDSTLFQNIPRGHERRFEEHHMTPS